MNGIKIGEKELEKQKNLWMEEESKYEAQGIKVNLAQAKADIMDYYFSKEKIGASTTLMCF